MENAMVQLKNCSEEFQKQYDYATQLPADKQNELLRTLNLSQTVKLLPNQFRLKVENSFIHNITLINNELGIRYINQIVK
jgi:hypothetical protein